MQILRNEYSRADKCMQSLHPPIVCVRTEPEAAGPLADRCGPYGLGYVGLRGRHMCNLYSITTNQAAIIALFRVMNRYVGNLPPMPAVFPDYPAPVLRNAGDDREMVLMRWG